MALIYIQTETQTPAWRGSGSTVYLRIYASQTFYGTNGEQVTQGQVGGPNWYQQYTCTVTNGFIVVPQVILQSTTDSSVPTATYTAQFYTASGAQVNPPKLAQFFVDPTGFQVPLPYSAVEVASGGTAAVNGVYTYRGLSGNLPYYNLEGQSDSTTLYVIKNVSSLWKIYSSSGTILYASTNNANLPWDVAGWTAVGGIAPVPTVSEDAQILSTTWSAVALSNQAFGAVTPPYSYPGPFFNQAQTIAYVASVVGDGTTPYASSLVAGKTALDVDPALSTAPIAIGSNSPSTGTGSLVRATSPTLVTPAIGTPSSGTLTNCTGLPIAGVTGLGTGVGTFLVTPSSSNLKAAVTDETGSGALVFATAPAIGLVNGTGLPISTGVSGLGTGVATFLGTPSSSNLKAAVTDETGSGPLVFATSPTFTTPVLGTPSAGVLSACTGLPVSSGISGLGTGVATFLATPSSANLAAAVTNETGTGALVFATTPTLVTPVLGVATGTSVAVTGLVTSSGTAGIGYATGAGGTIGQSTNKSTTVILNKTCGAITMNAAALADATTVSFTVTNSTVASTDVVTACHSSAGTGGAYLVSANTIGSGSFKISVRNVSGGPLSEAIVITFAVTKAVTS